MKVTIAGSKKSESVYITRSFVNDKGKTTSETFRKLGTMRDLLEEHGPTRDDVIKWAREEARIETEKYKKDRETKSIHLIFRTDEQIKKGQAVTYRGGYLFPQNIYYRLQLDKICHKLREKYKFQYDINAILSDILYGRILEPSSKRSGYETAQQFLEKPTYKLHDVYRALDVLGNECDFIQSEVYKNSHLLGKRNDKVLYYDCTNYYFEIEQEDGDKKYGKSKEHRPNPILQMGLFMDGDGIPLAFSLFPGNANEQTSVKPLEEKILREFGCEKFIYCSDAGLGSENIRRLNHIGKRAFIVTQSIKKLNEEDRSWALDKKDFFRVSDCKPVDITRLPEDDDGLYFKEIAYTPKEIHQRLIITYSPRYARYQKTIRSKQVERAEEMVKQGHIKKERRNPNDPARFVGKNAVTKEGEAAEIYSFLDTQKIEDEAKYDGFYAVCTDLLEDCAGEILAVSEGRWQIEECFRIMKTDFEARPVFLQNEIRIKAHFLSCFLALLIYRFLERILGKKYTCDEILNTLRNFNFTELKEQGFVPAYTRSDLTDLLHEKCGFHTDFEFITKSQMKTIQKISKGR